MTTLELFTEFENFIKPKLEHSVFINSDTKLVFKNLNNALNCYSQNKSRILVEQLTDGTYLVFNRGLTNPVSVQTENEVLKLVGSLC